MNNSAVHDAAPPSNPMRASGEAAIRAFISITFYYLKSVILIKRLIYLFIIQNFLFMLLLFLDTPLWLLISLDGN